MLLRLGACVRVHIRIYRSKCSDLSRCNRCALTSDDQDHIRSRSTEREPIPHPYNYKAGHPTGERSFHKAWRAACASAELQVSGAAGSSRASSIVNDPHTGARRALNQPQHTLRAHPRTIYNTWPEHDGVSVALQSLTTRGSAPVRRSSPTTRPSQERGSWRERRRLMLAVPTHPKVRRPAGHPHVLHK